MKGIEILAVFYNPITSELYVAWRYNDKTTLVKLWVNNPNIDHDTLEFVAFNGDIVLREEAEEVFSKKLLQKMKVFEE